MEKTASKPKIHVCRNSSKLCAFFFSRQFVHTLAFEDRNGRIAAKVMELLWDINRRPQTPRHILDITLNAHLRLLTSSSTMSEDRKEWMRR